MTGPNPNAIYPNEAIKSVVFIKNVITRPNVIDTTEQTVSETIESIKAHLKSGQNRIG